MPPLSVYVDHNDTLTFREASSYGREWSATTFRVVMEVTRCCDSGQCLTGTAFPASNNIRLFF